MIKKKTLHEIHTDIAFHEQQIKQLRDEIKKFQSECPHPDNFSNEEYKTTEDEYGRVDSTYTIRTCVLCGLVQHLDHKERY